jgi:hypothetical protein
LLAWVPTCRSGGKREYKEEGEGVYDITYPIPTMTSILSSVSHHLAAMANREIQPGSKFPTNPAVKEDDPEQTFRVTGLTGRNVFV